MVRLLLIVTGASRGLGRCIAKAFHEDKIIESISTHLIARSAENLEQTRREILETIQERHNVDGGSGGDGNVCHDLQTLISIHPMDLGDLATLEERMGAVFEEISTTVTDFDRFVLINNHGTLGHLGPAACLLDERCSSLEDMQHAVNLNVTSCLWISVMASRFVQKYCNGSSLSSSSGPNMAGTIVNISSLAALQPFPTMAIYAAGKSARDMYHACLAKELPGNDKDTDKSNDSATTATGKVCLKYLNYAPGPLETDMTTQLRSEQDLDVNLKTFFQNKLIDPLDSARVLVQLVLENEFENGQHIDYYDIVPPPQQQHASSKEPRD